MRGGKKTSHNENLIRMNFNGCKKSLTNKCSINQKLKVTWSMKFVVLNGNDHIDFESNFGRKSNIFKCQLHAFEH